MKEGGRGRRTPSRRPVAGPGAGVAVRRAAAVLGVVAVSTIPALSSDAGRPAARPASTVREVVVASLAPDGSVRSVRVEQLVRLAAGRGQQAAVRIPAAEGLDYRVLSGFRGPARRAGGLEWRTADRLDAVALARVRKALPLGVRARYWLNGRPVAPRELRGKSGTVRIELVLENRTRRSQEVSYESVSGNAVSRVPVYVPLEFSVLAEFPRRTWDAVGAEGAYVQTDRRGDQILVRPGALDPPFGPPSETVVIEAQGRRVALPEIRILAAPRNLVQGREAVLERLRDAKGMVSGLSAWSTLLGAAHEGTLQMAAGIDKLLAAVGERDPKTGRAVEAVDPKGIPQTLLWGLQSSKDAYDQKLIPGMDRLIAGLDALIGKIQTLDPSNPGLVEGLQQIADGIGLLVSKLHSLDPAQPGLREAIEIVRAAAQNRLSLPPAPDPLSAGTLLAIGGVAEQLLNGLGERNPDGSPKIVLDPSGTPTTVIGALGFMRAAITDRVLPGVGARDPQTGKAVVTLDPSGTPTTLLGALGFIRDTALTNPEFTKPQPEIGGRTPFDYFLECPFCFDPTKPVFDRRLADPKDPSKVAPKFEPGFREAFQLFSRNLEQSLPRLHTFQLDPARAGLVDALQLLRGGVLQLSQGLFTVNELGLRTLRGQASESADAAALEEATAEEQAAQARGHAFLAEGAEQASTSYLLEIAAGTGPGRDNAIRGALAALAAIAVALLARRPAVGAV